MASVAVSGADAGRKGSVSWKFQEFSFKQGASFGLKLKAWNSTWPAG
jgi:hypothetical protein